MIMLIVYANLLVACIILYIFSEKELREKYYTDNVKKGGMNYIESVFGVFFAKKYLKQKKFDKGYITYLAKESSIILGCILMYLIIRQI